MKLNEETAANGRNLKSAATSKRAKTYLPPLPQILELLQIQHKDLSSTSVTISVQGLKHLFAELLKHVEVDEAWYIKKYPDVHAAILSGDIASAATHFRIAGYFEGRAPHELPFDYLYYFGKYQDLAAVFEATDIDGLREHYETKGYYEGRAGVEGHFADAEHWRTAAQGKR